MDMIRKEAGISTYALIESDNFVPTAGLLLQLVHMLVLAMKRLI